MHHGENAGQFYFDFNSCFANWFGSVSCISSVTIRYGFPIVTCTLLSAVFAMQYRRSRGTGNDTAERPLVDSSRDETEYVILLSSQAPYCRHNLIIIQHADFHKYLQTKPAYQPGVAILDDYTTAGQFKIESGQFMQLISAPGEPAKYLYAVVSPQKQKDGRVLSVNFTSAPVSFGTFAFQGDSVIWTPPGGGEIKRKNNAAWFVCEMQQLFINLGDYLGTQIAGCADHTVSSSPLLCFVIIMIACSGFVLDIVLTGNRFTSTMMRKLIIEDNPELCPISMSILNLLFSHDRVVMLNHVLRHLFEI
jgi:hypothetical protein